MLRTGKPCIEPLYIGKSMGTVSFAKVAATGWNSGCTQAVRAVRVGKKGTRLVKTVQPGKSQKVFVPVVTRLG